MAPVKRKKDTEKQKAARLRKQADVRNVQRRAKYATDESYRKRAIESTRRSYRSKHGRVDDGTCSKNLKNLSSFGDKRPIPGGKSGLRVTFTVSEVSNAINRNKDVVSRWIGKGMFPAPGNGDLYTLAQARVLVHLMGEHQRETSYYRTDNVELRVALHAAMEE